MCVFKCVGFFFTHSWYAFAISTAHNIVWIYLIIAAIKSYIVWDYESATTTDERRKKNQQEQSKRKNKNSIFFRHSELWVLHWCTNELQFKIIDFHFWFIRFVLFNKLPFIYLFSVCECIYMHLINISYYSIFMHIFMQKLINKFNVK